MEETIPVKGGAGYIGSHIVCEFAADGYAPVIVDSFATSSPSVLPRLRKLTGQAVPSVICADAWRRQLGRSHLASIATELLPSRY